MMQFDFFRSRTARSTRGIAELSIAVLVALAIGGCSGQGDDSSNDDEPNRVEAVKESYFEDVAEEAGLSFTYRNGEEAGELAILESLGGGVGILDYDKDGRYDIFLPGGGYFVGPERKRTIKSYPCKLFRNEGNWKFRDVTAEVGLAGVSWPYSHAAAVGDYDRDGWPDLVVTGFGRVLLFRNEQGKRFIDVSEDVLPASSYHWPTSAAFADFDGDGWTDLYVCQYTDWSFSNHPRCGVYAGYWRKKGIKYDVCSPRKFRAMPDFLYRNCAGPQPGTRRFVDVGGAAGIRVQVPDTVADIGGKPRKLTEDEKKGWLGKGLGVLVFDYNDDGRPDIYVANDTEANFLYVNQSEPGKMKFVERGNEELVALDEKAQRNGSMGIDAADIDGRGMPSIWVTNYESELHALYHMDMARGHRHFAHRTTYTGAGSVGPYYVGWGTRFFDLENDGDMDIVVANGHVIRYPYPTTIQQRPILFRNRGYEYFRKHRGRGLFENITDSGGDYFRSKHSGRGLAVADLDNDGKPDLVISHVNEPVAVLRNIVKVHNHFVGVLLAGKDGRDVTGAKAVLELPGRTLTRFQKSGGSFASSSDPRLLFGLADHSEPVEITVYWPGSPRQVERFGPLAIDRYHVLAEGAGKPAKSGG